MEYNNYEQIIVSTLKNLARERGLRGYSRLRKAELIEQLRNPTPLEYTRAQLIQLAREREVYEDTLGLIKLSYLKD